MFRRSRKGLGAVFMTLAGIIVGLLVLITLLVIFRSIAEASDANTIKTRCKTSVTAYARIKSMPSIPFTDGATGSAADIQCPTRYITIQKAEGNSMRREIADLMMDCWDNFGEGNLRIFTGFETYCAICYVFQFEDKSTKLTGLPSYMMLTKAPIIREKRHPTYYEFITGDTARETDISAAKGSADLNALDGSKRYAVMFTAANVNMWNKVKQKSKLWAYGTAATNPTLAHVMTKTTAGSSSSIITAVYDTEGIREVGCTTLPVTQMDERFR
jgi:hypothetical protein